MPGRNVQVAVRAGRIRDDEAESATVAAEGADDLGGRSWEHQGVLAAQNDPARLHQCLASSVKVALLVLADSHRLGELVQLLWLVSPGLNKSQDTLGKHVGRHAVLPRTWRITRSGPISGRTA